MNRVLQIMMCLLVGTTTGTVLQAKNQSRKDLRQEVKRTQAVSDSLSYIQAFDALKQGRFVVEVDRLSFKRGKTASVSTNTNFISRDRSVAVVQVTFNGVRPGPSGIGGITLRGTVSDVHLEEGHKGIVYYSMRVLGGGIAAEIRITLTSGSNRVRVEVDPDFNSNDITMDGRIVPYDDSSVYRGRVY